MTPRDGSEQDDLITARFALMQQMRKAREVGETRARLLLAALIAHYGEIYTPDSELIGQLWQAIDAGDRQLFEQIWMRFRNIQ